MHETDKARELAQYFRHRGACVLKIHGSEYMAPGTHDLICCWHGNFFTVEVKLIRNDVKMPGTAVLNKRLYSENQLMFAEQVSLAGGVSVGAAYCVKPKKWLLHYPILKEVYNQDVGVQYMDLKLLAEVILITVDSRVGRVSP